ncbi:MAG: CBS domain-containing protein [Bacteroidota bacterium]
MNAKDLINSAFQPVTVEDTGLNALNLLEEYRFEHLPVIEGNKYIGLIAEQDILKLSALDQPLAHFNLSLIRPFVRAGQPVFEVVRTMSKDKLTIIPVLDEEGAYAGLVTLTDVMKYYSDSGIFEDANGVIVVEMSPKSYSMTELAHLIEAEEGRIMSAYVTPNPRNETIDVTIKINRSELTRIIASLNRHGYFVKEHYHQSEFMEDIKSRYDSLMNYLGI